MQVHRAESGPVRFYQEAVDPVGVAELGPDHRDVRHAAVGDPRLLAVDHEFIAVLHGSREHACRVRAEVGLGQPEAAHRLALLHRGQPTLLLLIGPVRVDGVHREAALHRDKTAQSGVAALELLHDQPVFDVAQPGAAVAGNVRAEESEIGDRRCQFVRECPVAEVLRDQRHELILDELSRGLPHQQLFLAQQRVELHEVDASKLEHQCLPIAPMLAPASGEHRTAC